MKCDWCKTQKCSGYVPMKGRPDVLVCQRCSDIFDDPACQESKDCLPIPDDADRIIVEIQKFGNKILTHDEYLLWAGNLGKDETWTEFLDSYFTSRKVAQCMDAFNLRLSANGHQMKIDFTLLKHCAIRMRLGDATPKTESTEEALQDTRVDELLQIYEMSPCELVLTVGKKILATLYESFDYENDAQDQNHEPLAVLRGKPCGSCQKKGNWTKTCSRGCKKYYCSKKCKQNDWKTHKKCCMGKNV